MHLLIFATIFYGNNIIFFSNDDYVFVSICLAYVELAYLTDVTCNVIN